MSRPNLRRHHAPRGSDALHLAATELVVDEATVLVSGDRELCTAARELGIAVADTSVADTDR